MKHPLRLVLFLIVRMLELIPYKINMFGIVKLVFYTKNHFKTELLFFFLERCFFCLIISYPNLIHNAESKYCQRRRWPQLIPMNFITVGFSVPFHSVKLSYFDAFPINTGISTQYTNRNFFFSREKSRKWFNV
jgi:hypothetical protein